MSEIKCPHCGKVFQIDEGAFASLAHQVRDEEFHRELEEREKAIIAQEKLKADADKEKLSSEKSLLEAEIRRLKDQDAFEKKNHLTEMENLKSKYEIKLREASAEAADKARGDAFEMQKRISTLENDIQLKEAQYQLKENNIREGYKQELALKDEQIAYYKDFKAKQSTKMIGESLERYCNDEFDKIRATAFPRAYFEKDNKVSGTGSKGDFIFRDYDENGEEIVSIMFEMKNEADTTDEKARHTNESFLKELDKDRNEKGCEYAVLVSMLEADSELYNQGIVDKSHRYPKMYVIRPQFFIPVITMLRNAAMNGMQYKHALTVAKSQNIDIENFETEMNEFKDKFSAHYNRASKRYQDAIADIQKTIDYLEKVKADLQGSQYSLDQASKRVDDLTIKRLTRKSPSVREAFAKADEKRNVEVVQKEDGNQ